MRIVGTVVAALAVSVSADTAALWQEFKETFGRQYSGSEEAQRFKCFQQNVNRIDELNNVDSTASYGMNKFTDLCADEFKAYHSLQVPSNRTARYAEAFPADVSIKAAADSIDWRTLGAVTGVKNQGQCGSCWAFSAVGNMEGQWFQSSKQLVSLSEEELVQCAKNGNNQGCQGGFMDDAFDWVVSHGGINSESGYPYTSGGGNTGTCNSAKSGVSVAKFTGGHFDVAKDEAQMAAWVQKNGPLSVAVDASGLDWQLYVGGVKMICNVGQLDHGVLIVGYGESTTGTPFWIVKNSWGATWGEKGYIRLHRGVNCNGINEAASSIKI